MIRCFLKRKGTIYRVLKRGSQVIWNQNILPVPTWRYLYAHQHWPCMLVLTVRFGDLFRRMFPLSGLEEDEQPL